MAASTSSATPSAAGVETICMPTAVLSTHTGGFTGYTYRDLTSDMPLITEHWKSIDLKFDAIYSGFLGSIEQIDIVKDFVKTNIDVLKKDNRLVGFLKNLGWKFRADGRMV